MPTGRTLPAVAAAGGRLFAIGGRASGFSDPGMSIVEAFDPKTGVWEAVAPMPTARYGAGAAVVDGKIYVAGGARSNTEAPLATVEVYDPTTNTWVSAPSMSTPRKFFGLAVLGGKLYAAGGKSGTDGHLKLAEVFDPQTQAWAPITPMGTARTSMPLTAVRGKLYAAGGAASAAKATVEAYDPQHDRWEAVASLSHGRHCHAAAAI